MVVNLRQEGGLGVRMMKLSSQTEPKVEVSRRFARFIGGTQWSDLGKEVQHEGKRALLNFFGQALGAAYTPTMDIAIQLLRGFSGGRGVGVIGRRERLDRSWAVFVNAAGANLYDYDDTHGKTIVHPTAPVAPVSLALGELGRRSGKAVLLSMILGIEVECRIGNAVSPNHYSRGWHITSTCGVYGAATAASKLLGLDTEKTAHALGIAASLSGGVVANLSMSAKNIGVGSAARNGLMAGEFAHVGYTAAPDAIEGALGWARACGDSFDIGKAFQGLGTEWEVLANMYKPYPCGVVLNAVIDASLWLLEEYEINSDKIAMVKVFGNQLLLDRANRRAYDDRSARLSISHCVAVALLYGKVELEEFGESIIFDSRVEQLSRRVESGLDVEAPTGSATVVIEYGDGHNFTKTVKSAKGSTERPLTDLELEDKMRKMACQGGYMGEIDKLIDTIWEMERVEDISAICS